MSSWEDTYVSLCKWLGADYYNKGTAFNEIDRINSMTYLDQMVSIINKVEKRSNWSFLGYLAGLAVTSKLVNLSPKLFIGGAIGGTCIFAHGLLMNYHNRIIVRRRIDELKKKEAAKPIMQPLSSIPIQAYQLKQDMEDDSDNENDGDDNKQMLDMYNNHEVFCIEPIDEFYELYCSVSSSSGEVKLTGLPLFQTLDEITEFIAHVDYLLQGDWPDDDITFIKASHLRNIYQQYVLALEEINNECIQPCYNSDYDLGSEEVLGVEI